MQECFQLHCRWCAVVQVTALVALSCLHTVGYISESRSGVEGNDAWCEGWDPAPYNALSLQMCNTLEKAIPTRGFSERHFNPFRPRQLRKSYPRSTAPKDLLQKSQNVDERSLLTQKGPCLPQLWMDFLPSMAYLRASLHGLPAGEGAIFKTDLPQR